MPIWSAEDELRLIESHVLLGPKWTSISQRIPGGRSVLEVKNHWYNTIRSKKAIKRGNKPSLLYCYASMCASSPATDTPEQRRVLFERAKGMTPATTSTCVLASGVLPAPQYKTSGSMAPCLYSGPGFFRTSEGFHYHSRR